MARRLISIQGQRFGKLTAIRHIHGKKWLFKCDCGTERINTKTNGIKSKSCGCTKKHGLANKSSEYTIWKAIKGRCNNKNNPKYKRYGFRGIKVCDRWEESFENFLSDMGKRPSNKYSIDRINNDGNYEPSNCRWATHIQQARNQRSNIKITINKKTKCLSEWCIKFGLTYSTIHGRINNKKWDPIIALLTPVRKAKFTK